MELEIQAVDEETLARAALGRLRQLQAGRPCEHCAQAAEYIQRAVHILEGRPPECRTAAESAGGDGPAPTTAGRPDGQ